MAKIQNELDYGGSVITAMSSIKFRDPTKCTSGSFVGCWYDGSETLLTDRRHEDLSEYPTLRKPHSIYILDRICYQPIINNEFELTNFYTLKFYIQ